MGSRFIRGKRSWPADDSEIQNSEYGQPRSKLKVAQTCTNYNV